MKFGYSKLHLPCALLAITLLTPVIYLSQIEALEASLTGLKPNGDEIPIALSDRPILLKTTISKFMVDGITQELSTKWTEVEDKRRRQSSHYFNDLTFSTIQQQEIDGGVYDYLRENKINKYVINTITPVVLHQRETVDGNMLYIVQGEFLRTFRSRSNQRSNRYTVTTSIAAKSNPTGGRPLEIVEYWAPGL